MSNPHPTNKEEENIYERLDKVEFALKEMASLIESGEWVGVAKYIREIIDFRK